MSILIDISIISISFFVSVGIIAIHPYQSRLAGKTKDKIQDLHSQIIPRVGSISIIVGILLSFFLPNNGNLSINFIILASAIPVFICGFMEDTGFSVSPLKRLAGAAASGALGSALFGVWLTHINLAVVDDLMKFVPVAIMLTIFAATTLAHAYNLIDGLNGLSSGLAIISLVVIHLIALQVGDTEITSSSKVLVCALLGFWIINFFTGRVFLGDAGAYFCGHCVAWFSVLLFARNPEISPWALFLNTAVPVADTLATIYRRARQDLPIHEPDTSHIHHCVFKFFENLKLAPQHQNSTAAGCVLAFAALCSTTAFSLNRNDQAVFYISIGVIIFVLTLIKLSTRQIKP